MKKKGISFILSLALSLTMIPSVSFASTTESEWDKVNSTQGVTETTPEELNRANEKEKDAKDLLDAIESYKKGKISREEFSIGFKKFNDKYGKKASTDKSSMQLESTIALATSDSQVLGFSVAKQTTDWYCGPASAYNILHGIGITSNPFDGRALSQYNLAVDLGALNQGALWPNTWASTLNRWLGWTFYVTTNAPSASSILNNAYVDTINYLGSIYDTHMIGSNQLYGYAQGSERWHYLGGDGYNNSTSEVHYLDSNNLNSTAFGAHWATASMMAKCTAERGMAW